MINVPQASREERREARHRQRQQRRQTWIWLLALTAGAVLAVTGILVAQIQSRDRSADKYRGLAAQLLGSPLVKNLADVTLVVYNESDPLSVELAKYYAFKRHIPKEQVVGLKCPVQEEISREDYDKTIADPLRAIFDERGWWTRNRESTNSDRLSDVTDNHIRFIALIRGMPLKISPVPAYEGDPGSKMPSPIREQNAASVDSELAVLGYFTRAISGFIPNPYYRSYNHITENLFPRLMLVARLDAPTGSMVERMIDDSLEAEKTGLWGRCYLDSRGFAPGSSPLAEGDVWISKIKTSVTPYILPTIIDSRPEMFSREYPMTETAFYCGWYSEDAAGPFTRPDFHFERGAVACHIHSFSAWTLRDTTHHWAGPLLDRGAAATLGNVFEPYLTLTTHLDIFAARLFDGFTLAESAYAGTLGLSWMDVVIGDPLYRPGKVWQDLNSDLTNSPVPVSGEDPEHAALVAEGRAYWSGSQTWRARGPAEGGKALEKSGREMRSGRIYEGLGLLRATAGDVRGACAAFDKAMTYYKSPSDSARVILDEAQALADNGQKSQALELIRKHKGHYANQVAGTALDQLEVVLGGPS